MSALAGAVADTAANAVIAAAAIKNCRISISLKFFSCACSRLFICHLVALRCIALHNQDISISCLGNMKFIGINLCLCMLISSCRAGPNARGGYFA
jgi:hypothetical protein